MNFAKYKPCLYEKEILCSECKTHPNCDMRIGREIHQKCYEDGYAQGVKHRFKPVKKHHWSCVCGWLHLAVYPGFKCNNCGRIFEPEESTK